MGWGSAGKKGEDGEGGSERGTAGRWPRAARGERRGSRALVPIRGFRERGKSALRPPHPCPRPGEPRGGGGGGGVSPSASPPINALQLPARGRRGPAWREPGPPASAAHLRDARPGAVPHRCAQLRVAAAPGGREEPERPGGARDGAASAGRAASAPSAERRGRGRAGPRGRLPPQSRHARSRRLARPLAGSPRP